MRLRRRLKGQTNQSKNIVDSIVKAHALYKKLSIKAHPDRNPDNRDIAEELMQRITSNKNNYAQLLTLEQEVNEKLNNRTKHQ